MIHTDELTKLVSWFKTSKDNIRDEVIKAGLNSSAAESFDIPHLYDSLHMILNIDATIRAPCIKDYDKYSDVAPFAMICKIIELYRMQLK